MTATEQRSSAVPTSRGRRRSGRQGGSRALGVVAGLLLLGGAIGVQALAMSPEERSSPLTYAGAKGEAVDTGRFTVRLDSFSAAKSVKGSRDTVATDHIFLIVIASAKSAREPFHLDQPVLLTSDGKRFTATDRVDRTQTLSNTWVQPDIWVKGRFFFEVPPTALPGARVIFDEPVGALSEANRPEVEADLGLDEAGARKLVAEAQDVYSTGEK